MKRVFHFFLNAPQNLVLFLVWVYQRILSPDHSFWAKRVYPNGYCRFYPSCSMYARDIIQKRGIILGVPKALWRIVRCNPWNKGGVDMP